MRKIFPFFVAVMAVSSLSAKSIYLQVNDDWKSFGAVFFVHSWGGAADADAKLALVEGEEYLFSAEIPNDNNNLLFVRAQGDSQSIPWDTENLWTKTSDLVIPEGKDCYYLVGWTDGAWLSHGDSPAISIVGNFKGDETWGSGAHPMTIAGDKASASVTFALEAGAYEMKVWLEGLYLSLNGEGETLYQIHRDWNHADNVNMVNSGRNFEFVADQAGDYTFTWTFASQNLVVAFPVLSTVETIQTEGKTLKRIVNGELRIIRDGKTFNALGAEVK